MAKYLVLVQHQEENEENISVTGAVNGVQTAVVIRKGQVKGLKGAKLQSEIVRRLAMAYKVPVVPAGAGGVEVEI